ncbi:hypothetical protein SSP35_04_00390 [Streptomyces sp. NBRC 110611]|uniref:hypothetical protein n=1 Tax=Streptomyces sp. NBRC 110611 TaxID=1621259 RepID=UPI000831A759|nr:hypothetical protein [Streptomyces sp. NBRC 110611]GAU66960.1 hypothetical protein SSP35_04_00390 [Streptomyces sp. NBRC 110611]
MPTAWPTSPTANSPSRPPSTAPPPPPTTGTADLAPSTSRALATHGHVTVHTGARVHSLRAEGHRIRARLATTTGPRDVLADHVIALTGYTGDHTLYRQLQVHECYATGAPMNLSAALLAASGASTDCLAQPAPGIGRLRNPEPHFFLLGAKSYGRLSTFLRTGYQQVDEIAAAYAAASASARHVSGEV